MKKLEIETTKQYVKNIKDHTLTPVYWIEFYNNMGNQNKFDFDKLLYTKFDYLLNKTIEIKENEEKEKITSSIFKGIFTNTNSLQNLQLSQNNNITSKIKEEVIINEQSINKQLINEHLTKEMKDKKNNRKIYN